MEEKSPAIDVVPTVVEQLRVRGRKKTILRADQQVNDKTVAQLFTIDGELREEGTEQDDDKVTKAGQSSTGQAGKISRGHAEAHAPVRSSRELGNEWSCETTRKILAKAKADPEQGIAGVQKALSILRDHNGRHWKSGDLKEQTRDLHLETAEMRSELHKKRVEKSLINDEVDGRLIRRIGHRLRLRK